MLKKHRRAAPLICKFDLNSFSTVMVFVAFFLLVIGMNYAPMPGQRGVSVDIPQANASQPMPDADREDAIVIAIARDGKIYLGSDHVEPHTLPRLICNRLADTSVRKVFLKVDRRAKCGVVNPVLADIRATGTEHICFVVERRYWGSSVY